MRTYVCVRACICEHMCACISVQECVCVHRCGRTCAFRQTVVCYAEFLRNTIIDDAYLQNS